MNETCGGTRASPIVMHPKMPTEYVPGFTPEESAAIAREALKKWVAVLANGWRGKIMRGHCRKDYNDPSRHLRPFFDQPPKPALY